MVFWIYFVVRKCFRYNVSILIYLTIIPKRLKNDVFIFLKFYFYDNKPPAAINTEKVGGSFS